MNLGARRLTFACEAILFQSTFARSFGCSITLPPLFITRCFIIILSSLGSSTNLNNERPDPYMRKMKMEKSVLSNLLSGYEEIFSLGVSGARCVVLSVFFIRRYSWTKLQGIVQHWVRVSSSLPSPPSSRALLLGVDDADLMQWIIPDVRLRLLGRVEAEAGFQSSFMGSL